MIQKKKIEDDLLQNQYKYAAFLKGKTITLAGQVEEIYKYDIVIRLHGMIESRIDVLYSDMNENIDIDELHRLGVKFVIALPNSDKDKNKKNIYNFAEKNLKSNSPICFCLSHANIERVTEIIGLSNNQTSIILDILHYDIKRLYINTFYKDNLSLNDKELKYIEQILKNNPRIAFI